MTTKLSSYHNEPKLKERLIATARKHRKADELAQGIYYAPGNGHKARMCAVGCLLKDPRGGHERYESEFGLPVELAHLEDLIFEGLPFEEAKEWPEQFLAAVPVGKDLRPAILRIRARVVREVAKAQVKEDQWGVDDAIEFAARLCEMESRGEVVSEAENARCVNQAAEAARTSRAADAARASRAADAARASRAADAARAEWAAWAADAARAEWAAWAAWAARATRAAWRKIRDITLEELERAGGEA